MKSFKILMVLLGTLLSVGSLSAQERSAGGSQQYQASWSSLKTMIDQTNGLVSGLQADLGTLGGRVGDLEGLTTTMTNCGNAGKLYGPEYSPAKGKCVDVQSLVNSNELLISVLNCGKRGLSYDQVNNTCAVDDSVVLANGNDAFNSSTSSNNPVTQNYVLPIKARFIHITTTCSAKGVNASMLVSLKFNSANDYPNDVLCDLLDVDDDNTVRIGYTKIIPVPEGATGFTIKRTSMDSGNKTIATTIRYLK
jgi:hypothetical protein